MMEVKVAATEAAKNEVVDNAGTPAGSSPAAAAAAAADEQDGAGGCCNDNSTNNSNWRDDEKKTTKAEKIRNEQEQDYQKKQKEKHKEKCDEKGERGRSVLSAPAVSPREQGNVAGDEGKEGRTTATAMVPDRNNNKRRGGASSDVGGSAGDGEVDIHRKKKRRAPPAASNGGGGAADADGVAAAEGRGEWEATTSRSDNGDYRRWGVELHRSLVGAIFDVGMKHASPAVIMEEMATLQHQVDGSYKAAAASTNGNDDKAKKSKEVTSERVKSHLQKYRNNRIKSKADFLKEYDAWMGKALELQEKGSSLPTGSNLLGGELPAYLSYSVMRVEGALLGGGGGGPSSSSPPCAAHSRMLGDIAGEDSSGAHPPSTLTRAAMRDMSAEHARRCFTSGARVPYPILTEEEQRSPLGVAIEQVIALFHPMTQWLMQERLRLHGMGLERMDEAQAPLQLAEGEKLSSGGTAGAAATADQELLQQPRQQHHDQRNHCRQQLVPPPAALGVGYQAMQHLVANLPGNFAASGPKQQDQQQHQDFQQWSKQQHQDFQQWSKREADGVVAAGDDDSCNSYSAHISQQWDAYSQQQQRQQQHPHNQRHPRPDEVHRFSEISPFHTDSIVQQQGSSSGSGVPGRELQHSNQNEFAIAAAAAAAAVLGDVREEDVSSSQLVSQQQSCNPTAGASSHTEV